MKKVLLLILTVAMMLGLLACTNKSGAEQTATEAIGTLEDATADDIAKLDSLYAERLACHGELHDHANTGGWSDGKSSLNLWRETMTYAKDMDFAVIVDHKQVLHMVHPDWDNNLFIGGTEAGTEIDDPSLECNVMHYNMIFAEVEGLENTLMAFPGYKYVPMGDYSSRYYYADFTHDRMAQLSQTVLDNGGFFVHVHPKGDGYLLSQDPLDYLFAEYTGLEVFCSYYGNMSAEENQRAYKLWTDLLALDKHVYATAGSDSHRQSNTISLTTIYSQEKNAKAYLEHVRAGDFTAGPVGIRMAVGDTRMGGQCSFEGNRLVLSVGDFHSLEFDATHTYRLDLYDDSGLVFSRELSGSETAYFAVDADSAVKFYRAEVYDVTENYQFAIGNPIWNA